MGGSLSDSNAAVVKELEADFPEEEKFFGLHNFGNTCYLNSVIQGLFACGSFRKCVLQFHHKHGKSGFPDDSILMRLASLFQKIANHKNRTGLVEPKKLLRAVLEKNEMFEEHQQQDAQEFLIWFLNSCAEDLVAFRKHMKRRNKRPASEASGKLSPGLSESEEESSSSEDEDDANQKTWVQKIFEGTLSSETQCLRCDNITTRDETFLDLSLIPEDNSSITHCLKAFSDVSMLHGDNKYKCESCGCSQEAGRRMRVKQLPSVLVLHLKRFKYVPRYESYSKLFHTVAFPFHLKMPNCVPTAEDFDRDYHLFGVVVHIGGGPRMGHYRIVLKKHGLWFLYDDDDITPVTESFVRSTFGSKGQGSGSSTAYLLFYQSRLHMDFTDPEPEKKLADDVLSD